MRKKLDKQCALWLFQGQFNLQCQVLTVVASHVELRHRIGYLYFIYLQQKLFIFILYFYIYIYLFILSYLYLYYLYLYRLFIFYLLAAAFIYLPAAEVNVG